MSAEYVEASISALSTELNKLALGDNEDTVQSAGEVLKVAARRLSGLNDTRFREEELPYRLFLDAVLTVVGKEKGVSLDSDAVGDIVLDLLLALTRVSEAWPKLQPVHLNASEALLRALATFLYRYGSSMYSSHSTQIAGAHSPLRLFLQHRPQLTTYSPRVVSDNVGGNSKGKGRARGLNTSTRKNTGSTDRHVAASVNEGWEVDVQSITCTRLAVTCIGNFYSHVHIAKVDRNAADLFTWVVDKVRQLSVGVAYDANASAISIRHTHEAYLKLTLNLFRSAQYLVAATRRVHRPFSADLAVLVLSYVYHDDTCPCPPRTLVQASTNTKKNSHTHGHAITTTKDTNASSLRMCTVFNARKTLIPALLYTDSDVSDIGAGDTTDNNASLSATHPVRRYTNHTATQGRAQSRMYTRTHTHTRTHSSWYAIRHNALMLLQSMAKNTPMSEKYVAWEKIGLLSEVNPRGEDRSSLVWLLSNTHDSSLRADVAMTIFAFIDGAQSYLSMAETPTDYKGTSYNSTTTHIQEHAQTSKHNHLRQAQDIDINMGRSVDVDVDVAGYGRVRAREPCEDARKSSTTLKQRRGHHAMSFTTRSQMLGGSVIAVHSALITALRISTNINDCITQIAILKCLTALILSTPYTRLPAHLLRVVLVAVFPLLPTTASTTPTFGSGVSVSFDAEEGTSDAEGVDVAQYCVDVGVGRQYREEMTISTLTCLGALCRANCDPLDRTRLLQSCKFGECIVSISTDESMQWGVRQEAFQTLSFLVRTHLSIFEPLWVNGLSVLVNCILSNETSLSTTKLSVGSLLIEYLKSLDAFVRENAVVGVDTSVDMDCRSTDKWKGCDSTSVNVKLSATSKAQSTLTSLFTDILSSHVPNLLNAEETSLRVLACDLCACMNESTITLLTPILNMQLKVSLLGLSMDEATLVKSAAFRALGILVVLDRIRTDGLFLNDLAEVGRRACEFPVLTVRLKATWALASLCDALVLDMNCRKEGDVSVVGEYGNGEERKVDEGIGVGLHGDMWTTLHAKLLGIALSASDDNDKVMINIIRMLGCLVRLATPTRSLSRHTTCTKPATHSLTVLTVNFDKDPECVESVSNAKMYQRQPAHTTPKQTHEANEYELEQTIPYSDDTLIQDSISIVAKTIGKGSAKLRWNACYAMSHILATPHVAPASYRDGIRALCVAVKESKNFKIRINSAQALCVLNKRERFGGCGCDCICAYADCTSGRENTLESGCACGSGCACESGCTHESLLYEVFTAVCTSLRNLDKVDAVAEYRYRDSLEVQLWKCIVKLVNMFTPADIMYDTEVYSDLMLWAVGEWKNRIAQTYSTPSVSSYYTHDSESAKAGSAGLDEAVDVDVDLLSVSAISSSDYMAKAIPLLINKAQSARNRKDVETSCVSVAERTCSERWEEVKFAYAETLEFERARNRAANESVRLCNI